MNNKYNIISEILKEMMNSSVSFAAYETPATKVVKKKKTKKKEIDLIHPQYPN